MYLVSYTIERGGLSIDKYELQDTLEEARAVVAEVFGEATMWAIAQVVDASEPHWAD